MAWSCAPPVAPSTAPSPCLRLRTQWQQSPPLPSAAASAARTSPSPLAASSCSSLPPASLASPSLLHASRKTSRWGTRQLCRAAEYVFPDPIPEFAESEIDKFKSHLMEKLSKRNDIFGTSVEEIVGICTGILSEFLHTEYGGPGTLLVIPFIDMADTINERGLPGGPQAARAAVVWAQKNVDEDWKEWTGGDTKS